MSEWSIDDVCEWLKAIGLEDYMDNMRSHDMGGAELLSLQATDLVVSVREWMSDGVAVEATVCCELSWYLA